MTPEQAASLWQGMAGKMPQGMPSAMDMGLAEGWKKAFEQFQNMDLGAFSTMAQGAPGTANTTESTRPAALTREQVRAEVEKAMRDGTWRCRTSSKTTCAKPASCGTRRCRPTRW